MVNKFESGFPSKEDLEIKSETELEEAERIVAKYQEAIQRFRDGRSEESIGEPAKGLEENVSELEKGFEYPNDDTAFIVRKEGEYADSYAMELKILEHDYRPEIRGGIYYLEKVEGGWEIRPLLRDNFDTALNRFFKASERGGVVLEVIKPAIIHGHEKNGKIIVDSFTKGKLRTGRPF
ncbi:hypothetical protein A3G55_01900 [Candidatus Giovannonibacteria bacterium RIFCSPLOWO2_12_FULL_44_25]|uniref:Uncharacterized protein n=2 Tax=Candidatus Giovannoniibacteriota TaxID=1752738 RepID=A0A1F5W6F0_9BACT|nr:MAG: hypothetical protein UW15_C0024G0014 [Parcubacteria group bacterium GW2011_GWC1_44_10]KKT60199.1 MAG: hypothetical protein UW53_C0003G0110 [Candidatus Giovannonibacteria bacterium GW2011_GWA1_44_25]KKU30046.1 MAG: hypothetical protein UX43_C0003G0139 [Candidatus Giovannonibacteria bacterium GW2011_GWB1_46_20]OGF49403.1 MAG: hypothetical protein A2120_03735 [Candidatus Giovannonibacteria bacterium GWA2_45_15]OGF59863.1 MAG: hypothetical protein A2W40_02030 [Candidatus Giovannonibacteria 